MVNKRIDKMTGGHLSDHDRKSISWQEMKESTAEESSFNSTGSHACLIDKSCKA